MGWRNLVQIVHFGHSCVLLDTGSARLLLDPGSFSDGFEDLRDLDAILITHQHPDHLDDERLPALVAANPNATLVVDTGSTEQVATLGLTARTAQPGDVVEAGGATVRVVGGDHAMIHPEVPIVPNVGYLVDDGAFYHPGDSLFVPEQPIDVLGVPAGAPWLKIAEAVEFERAVAPRIAVPIHEAVLSEHGRESAYARLASLAPKGTEVRVLTPLEPADL
jgi:L-ascorbate metabolism protein UlaG (beta-lactamase superfamily)